MRKYTLRAPKSSPLKNLNLNKVLNPGQYDVATATTGPMLVIAGAGSGKTHTLTYRVAALIARGVKPEHILLLTFTNKAAKAMTDRVTKLLGVKTQRIWSGTFHSIAHRILRQDAAFIGYPLTFSIIDHEDSKTLMRSCVQAFKQKNAAPKTKTKRLPAPSVLLRILSMLANEGISLDALLEDRYSYFSEISDKIEFILAHYQKRKTELALMDFDDLLVYWQTLLTNHPERAKFWSSKFEHILVDEYQDTNTIQGDIIDKMSETHGNLMVVGDDCQSIYAFRGADYRNILEFPERHPKCQIYKLEINYRSTPQILKLANTSIAYNEAQYQKTLKAFKPDGPKPAKVILKDSAQEAQFICQRILDLIDDGHSFNDNAILYRAHAHSIDLQVELARHQIPFMIRSGLKFFEQAHIKDILAYLRFIFNPRDELSFLRLLTQWDGIGTKVSQKIWQHINTAHHDPFVAATHLVDHIKLSKRASESWHKVFKILSLLKDQRLTESPDEMMTTILESGYKTIAQAKFENADQRLSDLEPMINFAAQYADLDRFLGEIALLTTVSSQDILVGDNTSESDDDDDDEGAVCLTTIHKAKGLEWHACFVLALADGQFPNQRAVETTDGLEEERRLFYVAVTRAKKELYLCQPSLQMTRQYGLIYLSPSVFLAEIEGEEREENLVETWKIEMAE